MYNLILLMVLGSNNSKLCLTQQSLTFYMYHSNEKCSISLLAVHLKLALCLQINRKRRSVIRGEKIQLRIIFDLEAVTLMTLKHLPANKKNQT